MNINAGLYKSTKIKYPPFVTQNLKTC